MSVQYSDLFLIDSDVKQMSAAIYWCLELCVKTSLSRSYSPNNSQFVFLMGQSEKNMIKAMIKPNL